MRSLTPPHTLPLVQVTSPFGDRVHPLTGTWRPHRGTDILAELGREETGVITATLDLAAAKKHRAAFGFFRDRRPELYGRLTEDI